MTKTKAKTKRRPTTFSAAVGDVLRTRRVGVGITQKDAARFLGVSNDELCRKELGVRSITVDEVYALCALYELGISSCLRRADRRVRAGAA